MSRWKISDKRREYLAGRMEELLEKIKGNTPEGEANKLRDEADALTIRADELRRRADETEV